jgi:CheY-like chemotaxis protein
MGAVTVARKRILVVEDDEDTRAILRALLQHHGYEMIESQTAEEMLERFDALRPDLVIVDIRLPGMDGCQAIDILRERGFNRPILVFSEYYDLIADRIKACRHDGFFPKSKGPVELVGAIGRRLKRPNGPGTASPATA